jgi:DNA-binding NarL/FixJ family response regulator
MLSDLPARLRAVAELQRRRDRFIAGTWSFDTLDQAIDLALEPRRVVDQYLVRNVIRDSRRVRVRRRYRQREILATDLVGADQSASSDLETDIADVEYSTPDAELQMLDIGAQAVCDVGHSRAEYLLDALVEGRTVREIARMLSISPSNSAVLAKNLKRAIVAQSQRYD